VSLAVNDLIEASPVVTVALAAVVTEEGSAVAATVVVTVALAAVVTVAWFDPSDPSHTVSVGRRAAIAASKAASVVHKVATAASRAASVVHKAATAARKPENVAHTAENEPRKVKIVETAETVATAANLPS
jgi:hypothetical protein